MFVLLLLPKPDDVHKPKSNSNSKKKANNPGKEQNGKLYMAVNAEDLIADAPTAI